MDGRTRLALGGGSAFVVAAIALGSVLATNAAALADSPGRTILGPRVDITAAPRVAPATPAPAVTADVAASARPGPTPPTETVTAPAPVIVPGPGRPAQDTESVPEHTPEYDEVVAAFAAEDWGLVAAWADEYGWSGAQIREWFRSWKGETDTPPPSHGAEHATNQELTTELHEKHGDDRRSWSKPGDDAGPMPAPSGITSRDGRSAQRDGVEGRSHGSPDRGD
ncbi:hypothetical protein ACFQZV_07145 [Microbacterium koreense]|uniref:Uncharacterized protein n=1 Tax=Microbacterium koreense TaxID=323761 RepID=A0ABW2ZR05_9MICO